MASKILSMNLKSLLFRRDDSTAGTVIGVLAVAVAVGGNRFLGWEWSQFPNQPVPLAIGAILAIVAVAFTVKQYRS